MSSNAPTVTPAKCSGNCTMPSFSSRDFVRNWSSRSSRSTRHRGIGRLSLRRLCFLLVKRCDSSLTTLSANQRHVRSSCFDQMLASISPSRPNCLSVRFRYGAKSDGTIGNPGRGNLLRGILANGNCSRFIKFRCTSRHAVECVSDFPNRIRRVVAVFTERILFLGECN